MRSLALITLLSVGWLSGCAAARHGHCPPQPIVCPNCSEHCRLEVEKVPETRACWEVKCEAICIPPVRLPWTPCDAPLPCAKTRLVHVLEEKEYECERCHYKWTPVCCEACGQGTPNDGVGLVFRPTGQPSGEPARRKTNPTP